jgi:hypothetical protein
LTCSSPALGPRSSCSRPSGPGLALRRRRIPAARFAILGSGRCGTGILPTSLVRLPLLALRSAILNVGVVNGRVAVHGGVPIDINVTMTPAAPGDGYTAARTNIRSSAMPVAVIGDDRADGQAHPETDNRSPRHRRWRRIVVTWVSNGIAGINHGRRGNGIGCGCSVIDVGLDRSRFRRRGSRRGRGGPVVR